MFNANACYAWLDRMGLSRSCAWVLGVYFIACYFLQQALPAGETLVKSPLHFPVLTVFFILLCCGFLVARELQKKPRWRDLLVILASIAVYFSFFTTFGYVKSLIPILHPYALDPLFQKFELSLHFGRTPYQWIEPLLGDGAYPILDKIYLFGWVGVMFTYFFWQLFAFDLGQSRTIFLSSFVLTWILEGNILATLLSSVGPTYYSMFYQDHYTAMNQAIVDRLQAVNIGHPLIDAAGARDLLVSFANSETLTAVNGISAMPSLHNAMSILMAIHSVRYFPRLATFMVPFAGAIFLCSIMLGWHYAIDTYLAGIVTYGIWHYSKWEVLRHARLDATHVTD